jgi:hypothetical protein
MPKSGLGLFLALALLCLQFREPPLTSTSPPAPTFTTFDPPGSSPQGADVVCGFGTYASDINASGTIVGYFYDANQITHGFIRSPNSAFAIVDVLPPSLPGGPSGFGSLCLQGTSLVSINISGETAGSTSNGGLNSPLASAAFTRTPLGQVTMYPNPKDSFPSGLNPVAMNDSGAVVGYFFDTNFAHGFLIAPTGSFTQLDAPGPLTQLGQGTFPSSINANGDIVGRYTDSNGLEHGFLFQADGTFVSLDVPPSTGGTAATAINSSGTIIGTFYGDAGPQIFVHTPDGSYTLYTPPIADTSLCNTISINSSGIVVGSCMDTNFISHGFLLNTSGVFTTIDDPDASSSPYPGSIGNNRGGTTITGLNDSGAVIGYFLDAQNLRHGFLYQ